MKAPPLKQTRPIESRSPLNQIAAVLFELDLMKVKWLLVIFLLLGGYVWIWFFKGANLTAVDWGKEISYFEILKQAFTTGTIPWRSDPIIQLGTDRFLTIPEICFSPQILLLGVLEVKQFVVVNLLILYTVGFFGCLKLARRFNLSAFAFLFLIVLLNFNGYLTSRFAVGHQMWESIFYYPWFFYYLFLLSASPADRKVVFKLALVLFLILLEGGIHQYVWCNMFLGVLVLLRPDLRKSIILVVVFAAVASGYRILPAAWQCWNLTHPFLSGYPSLGILLMALTSIGNYNTPVMGGLFIPVGWWEYDMFVGAAGLFALIWYGLVTPKTSRSPEIAANMNSLGGAALVMFYLSLFDVYAIVPQLHLPLMNAEAVSSRFIIISFVFLLLIASDALSSALKNGGIILRTIAVLLLLGTGQQLYLHALVWRLQTIEQINHAPLVGIPVKIVGQPDATYEYIVGLGFLISLLTIAGIIIWLRGRRPKSN
jgi:hypothetical protein